MLPSRTSRGSSKGQQMSSGERKKMAQLFGGVFGDVCVKSKCFTQVGVLTDFRVCFSSVFLVIISF